jgi:hypothetical protein
MACVRETITQRPLACFDAHQTYPSGVKVQISRSDQIYFEFDQCLQQVMRKLTQRCQITSARWGFLPGCEYVDLRIYPLFTINF